MLQRHLKTHQPPVLLTHSAACPMDATVDLLPPKLPSPSPPPKRHDETPICDVCAKTFASQKTLKRHRQTVHRQSGGFSCRVCNRCFYRRDHLKPMLFNLPEEFPLPCPFDRTPQDPATHHPIPVNPSCKAIGGTSLRFARRCTNVSGRVAGQRTRGLPAVL